MKIRRAASLRGGWRQACHVVKTVSGVCSVRGRSVGQGGVADPPHCQDCVGRIVAQRQQPPMRHSCWRIAPAEAAPEGLCCLEAWPVKWGGKLAHRGLQSLAVSCPAYRRSDPIRHQLEG